jgi:plasmid maintenance system antidote protein VapI
MALRLARYFGTSAEMWMNLQAKYDLAVAEDELGERVKREVLPREGA